MHDNSRARAGSVRVRLDHERAAVKGVRVEGMSIRQWQASTESRRGFSPGSGQLMTSLS